MIGQRDGFRCELHMHTSYSDGYRTPEYMLGAAVAKGLSVVAITDHDNAHGARRAEAVAPHMGLDLIAGIEFTARWDDPFGPGSTQDVDVLGYLVDLTNPRFQAREREALDDLHDRVAACCDQLTAAGYPVQFEELRRRNPQYAGLRQLRDVLVAHGYRDSEQAAGKLLDTHWAQVRKCAFSLREQIEVIHAAGGVAILAHPGYIRWEGRRLESAQIAALVALGVDGLEVYHRSMDPSSRQHFAALAAEHDLLVTGGSDEHGWSPALHFMGEEPVTAAMVAALRTRRDQRFS